MVLLKQNVLVYECMCLHIFLGHISIAGTEKFKKGLRCTVLEKPFWSLWPLL
jgi:hypothetical protein